MKTKSKLTLGLQCLYSIEKKIETVEQNTLIKDINIHTISLLLQSNSFIIIHL